MTKQDLQIKYNNVTHVLGLFLSLIFYYTEGLQKCHGRRNLKISEFWIKVFQVMKSMCMCVCVCIWSCESYIYIWKYILCVILVYIKCMNMNYIANSVTKTLDLMPCPSLWFWLLVHVDLLRQWGTWIVSPVPNVSPVLAECFPPSPSLSNESKFFNKFKEVTMCLIF